MAFVYEQQRNLIESQPGSKSLGPGEYNFMSEIDRRKDAYYAPFLSTCKRSNNKGDLSTPGPGSYSLEKGNIHGEEMDKENMFHYAKKRTAKSGFLSTMTRFKASNQAIPGPGYYSQAKAKRRNKNSQAGDGVKRLLQDNLSKTRSLRVPAIPSKSGSTGYTVNFHNELVPIEQSQQKIVPLDPTITEEYQRKTSTINLDSIANKLFKYSKLALSQELASEKSHDNENSITSHSQSKPLKRKLRMNGDLPPKILRTIIPGPGAYEHQKQLKKDKKKQKFQFFGTSSLRFMEDNKNEPPPQHISIFQKSTDYNSGNYKESFAKSKRDLFNSRSNDNSPGPGNYLSNNFAYHQRKVVTSTQPRFLQTRPQYNQGERQYEGDDDKVVVRRNIHPEKKRQFQHPKKEEPIQNVSPAYYDVSSTDIAYDVMRHRSNAPFGSKGKRFCFESEMYDIPYLPEKDTSDQVESKHPNPFNSTENRFKIKKREDIGPGKYNQEESSGLLKYSYNIKYNRDKNS